MLKLLYFSTAYHASHGGSNHSKAFVKFANEHPAVSEVRVYPNKKRNQSNSNRYGSSVLSSLLGFSLFLPLRLYKRNLQNLEGLYSEIALYQPNVLVVRLDSNFLQINKIREKFPDLKIVSEVNASSLDEAYSNIIARPFFKFKEREALANCDLNFFVSSNLREKIMQDKLDRRRDFVNHNGYDDTLFRPVENNKAYKKKLGIPENAKVIGYVGTLDLHKKIDLFIEAISLIKKKHGNVVALVIGGGPAFEAVKEYANEIGLSNSFFFTGQVEHTNVYNYLGAIDIAVHHAANDYMSPLKVFEYLAVKLPVVAPDIPAVREIFTDEKHLLMTKPTVESIAEKLLLLLDKPEFSKRIAEQGHQHVASNFTWRCNVDNIIKEVLNLS